MTKIICELGINHFGSVKITKKLIDNAKLANAWGIKFQYRNLKSYFVLCVYAFDFVRSFARLLCYSCLRRFVVRCLVWDPDRLFVC